MLEKQIQLLEAIQSVDLEITRIIGKKESFTSEIERAEKDFQAAKTELEGARKELEELKLDQRRLLREVEEGRQRIEKDRERLKQARSEKEYRALLKEIEGLQKSLKEKEEGAIRVMERIEETELKVKEKKKALELIEKDLLRKKEGFQREKDTWDRELEEKRKVRDDIANSIRTDILKEYEFIRKRRKGVAVVPVKNGTCSGCNMSIPPQVAIQVQKRDQVVYCPYCRIILTCGERGGGS